MGRCRNRCNSSSVSKVFNLLGNHLAVFLAPFVDLIDLVGDLAQPFPYAEAWNAEPVDGTRPVEEQYRQQDVYWSPQHVNGALPICHHGCNLRECLIVSGPEKGNMWFDDRADWQGLHPDKKNDRNRLTFLEWYKLWIEERLLKLKSAEQ